MANLIHEHDELAWWWPVANLFYVYCLLHSKIALVCWRTTIKEYVSILHDNGWVLILTFVVAQQHCVIPEVSVIAYKQSL